MVAEPVSTATSWIKLLWLCLGYCICSGLLSNINKSALLGFSFPSILTFIQFAFCTVCIRVLNLFGLAAIEHPSFEILRTFSPLVLCNYAAIIGGTKVLQRGNVATFVTFRSVTPIFVSVLEAFLRPDEVKMPSARTFSCLLVIAGGAAGFMLSDSYFSFASYGWGIFYLAIACFDLVYVKQVLSDGRAKSLSNWTLVYYLNLGQMIIAFATCTLSYEFNTLYSVIRTAEVRSYYFKGKIWTWCFIGVSCIFGLAINFFGNATRREISATSFTVLGCMNKLLAVLVDVSVSRSSTLAGTSSLIFCIFGGLGYSLSIEAEKNSSKAASLEPVTEQQSSVAGHLFVRKYTFGALLMVSALILALFMLQPHHGYSYIGVSNSTTPAHHGLSSAQPRS